MEPNDVNESAPVVEPAPPAPVIETPPAPSTQPGEKTEPALLLKSLQEERDKRRDLERELQELKDAAGNSGEPLSEEGQVLQRQITVLTEKLSSTENANRLGALQTSYPALKDKATEFETYRADPNNKGMSLETAARAFLADNQLLAPPAPPRKGLENGGGGPHTPPKQGMSPEEVDDLRVNNYREYSRKLKAGEISIS